MKSIITPGLVALSLACSSVAMSAEQTWRSVILADPNTKQPGAIVTKTDMVDGTYNTKPTLFSFGYICNKKDSVATIILPESTEATPTTLTVSVDGRIFRESIKLDNAGSLLFFAGQDAADVTNAMIAGKKMNLNFSNDGEWKGSASLIGFKKNFTKHITACKELSK